ncbi:MAG: 4-hydroxythreonine-4-phosphate dehydrogenase PdxA [Planctomycetaceae bacterium]|nr:4-hydroxythreonine-4-phosphate dehydrogenase PdxA [Planctomycetaceae bacterium]
MISDRPWIAITAGDVSGIGPEIIVQACCDQRIQSACRPLVVCHPEILRQALQLCQRKIDCVDFRKAEIVEVDVKAELSGSLTELPQHVIPCLNPAGDAVLSAARGAVNAEAGDAAFHYLCAAIDLATSGAVSAIATAPLNKESLHAAGHPWPGHTEILAEKCGVRDYAMMLHLSENRIAPWRSLVRTSADSDFCAKDGLSIVHVTLHTSVRSVPQILTARLVEEKIRLMDDFLWQIGSERRSIAVAALNPHGGEHGLFGDEEETIIAPAIDNILKAQGDSHGRQRAIHVKGPLPVDTLIRRAVAGEFDGVVAMYHDQGHIPVKMIGFDSAVNITLGLPIVRTSPTHGTAFDRAWNERLAVDPSGMMEAVHCAVRLSQTRS